MSVPSSPSSGRIGSRIMIKPGGLVILTAVTTIAVVGAVNVFNRLKAVPVSVIQQKANAAVPIDVPSPVAHPPRSSNGIPIENYSFEDASADPTLADRWGPDGLGYQIDSSTSRSGKSSIRMTSANDGESHGARYVLMLNQTEAKPIEISAWSKASGVTGTVPGSYALYIDYENSDGTPTYGNYVDFSVGTHNWEYHNLQIHPSKPIRHAKIYLLLRKHTGTVWFDDVTCKPI